MLKSLMLWKWVTPKKGMVGYRLAKRPHLWPICVARICLVAKSSSPLGALDGPRCKRPRQCAPSFCLEFVPTRMQKQHPDDDRRHPCNGQGNRRRLVQMLDLLTEHVGSEAKRCRPDTGASGIEKEKARQRHAIDAG